MSSHDPYYVYLVNPDNTVGARIEIKNDLDMSEYYRYVKENPWLVGMEQTTDKKAWIAMYAYVSQLDGRIEVTFAMVGERFDKFILPDELRMMQLMGVIQ